VADQDKEAGIDSNRSLSRPEKHATRAGSGRPPLLRYSLLVPAVWLLLGGMLQWAAPTAKFGAFGLLLVLYAAVWITCWHFAKRFARHFLRKERIKLIVLTTIWALLVESLGLWTLIEDRALSGAPDLTAHALAGVLTFTFAFDAFMMWAAYTLLAKRILTKLLTEGSTAGA
jgi:cation transport ATPase